MIMITSAKDPQYPLSNFAKRLDWSCRLLLLVMHDYRLEGQGRTYEGI